MPRKRTSPDQSVGPTLRRLRERRGITLGEAAPHASTDAGSLSRIERGHRDLSYSQLKGLANLYGVSVAAIAAEASLSPPRRARKVSTPAA